MEQKEFLGKEVKRTVGELRDEIQYIVGKEEYEGFKKFAFKKNMIELAIAFILGGAFQKVVQSISGNLIMPLLQYLLNKTGNNWREYTFAPIEGLNLEIGEFFGSFVDFILIAAVLYILFVKIGSQIIEKKEKRPAGQKCKFCLSIIHLECKRCPNCTSWLTEI